MARVTRLDDPHWDDIRDRREGFICRRARVGGQAGAQRLGASLWEIPAGEAAYPYHWHAGDEELLFVLSGRPSLRGPDGWRELAEGEVVSFLTGPGGGHQIVNRTEEPVRMLVVSTNAPADVVLYPDSGKIGAYDGWPYDTGVHEVFRTSDAVDYWEGVEPPD